QLLTYACASMLQMWHTSGMCLMGRSMDALLVVDKYAKSKCVPGSRTVDTSMFPIRLRGHLHSNVNMIAEKITKEIKSGK
ncbi:uncharacterized protein BDZ99DRAFT_394267, partial [Mytilinidion resinicola]